MASKVRYKLSLSKYIKKAYADKTPEYRSKISQKLYDPDVKRLVGDLVIERIVDRTVNENIDKKGTPFKPYLKSYKDALIFQIYGKSSGDVNLRLTGEMLSSMKTNVVGNDVIIDFVDKLNNDKAHGHINGIRTKKGRVVRDFFGLPDDDVIDIIKKAISEDNIEKESMLISDAIQEMTDVGVEDV